MARALARLQETGDRTETRCLSLVTRHLCSVSRSLEAARNLVAMDSNLHDVSPALVDGSFATAMEDSITIASIKVTERKTGIDPVTLARNCGIGLETAKRTVNTTTQRGIRTVLHPTLSRRFRTNDRQLRYRRLPVDCFTDTMFSTVVSRRMNKCAQVFSMPNGWCRAYPMRTKSQAHEALSLLFQREGVPNVMIMDGANEQVKGEFRKKCRQAGVHVKQTEPYSPWQNNAESSIRELKKAVGQEMVQSKAPKRLWDDCLEHEAYIRSFMAHDIYSLNGEVPETIVSGETADISPFALFGWYE